MSNLSSTTYLKQHVHCTQRPLAELLHSAKLQTLFSKSLRKHVKVFAAPKSSDLGLIRRLSEVLRQHV